MSTDVASLYQDIKANLDTSRTALVKTSILGDEESPSLRLEGEAETILIGLEKIAILATDFLKRNPPLETIFEKEFGKRQELLDREAITETVFFENFLFPTTETYPVTVDGKISPELLSSYEDQFKAWCEDKELGHTNSQEILKADKFDLKLSEGDLPCHCVQCMGDYRTKIREEIYKLQVGIIDHMEDKLQDAVLFRKIGDISTSVYDLKKNLESNFNRFRRKLKRSSVSKLENEVKYYFRSKFGSKSELAKVYREKLLVYFNTLLVEQGLKPELVSHEEYERFFLQLETNMWKGEVFLKKEFERFTHAILALKRKDVSSTILRDYLGQFWLHSDARRLNRKVIYHMGPTNSGKTYHAIQALCAAKKGCYLAPLRLLASELFDTMNNNGVKTNLLTGEEVIEVEGASHYSSTIEMARLQERFDCCVIDEVQMLTDSQRGWAWTRALVNIQADEIHICGDHSVLELVKKILALTGDTLEIKEYTRMTELQIMKNQIPLTQLEKNDALIVFSRRNALKYKADLEELGFKVSIVYGRLSPEVRREQARKFDEGETDIMVSTDAIAMGMNLPVKRIVFSALSKFISEREVHLTHSEIKQISGRAGRFKRFPTGYVTTLNRVDDGLRILEEAISHHLGQSGKAMVGPDLDIFSSVNHALDANSLPSLRLSEFLRLFNTMTFEKPFYCVELKEMIELAEMVEMADENQTLSYSEIFGFACAPVNLGLMEHVQYYMWILNHYASAQNIVNEAIDDTSDDIDYLETSIKCVELYQWLSRHFSNKYFLFDEQKLLDNKSKAIEKLNDLLSEKISKTCSSCGCKMPANARFNICEECFKARRFSRRGSGPRRSEGSGGESKDQVSGSFRPPRRGGSGGQPQQGGKPGSGGGSGGNKGGAGKRSGPPKRPGGGGKKNPAAAFKKHR